MRLRVDWNPRAGRLAHGKVQNYIAFALDGGLVAMRPAAAELKWEIVVECWAGPPDEATAEAIALLAEAVRKYEGSLVFVETP